MNNLNAYEKFALNHFLSSYPEGYDIQGIFNMMMEYDDEVIAWELFYNEDPADLIREIESMIIMLEQSFVPREVK
jgi:hypothetical protein